MIYETREQGCNAFITEARPIFESIGYTIPANVRVSIGYAPNTRRRKTDKGRVIACVIRNTASADNHYEIFVSPDNATPVDVFAALTHELVHVATDFTHSRSTFGPCARALGLDGPLDATKPGAGWFNWAAPIVESIQMPYATINLLDGEVNRPTKETYALKIECPTCKWHARASAKNSIDLGFLNCPVPGCGDMLVIHPRKPD